MCVLCAFRVQVGAVSPWILHATYLHIHLYIRTLLMCQRVRQLLCCISYHQQLCVQPKAAEDPGGNVYVKCFLITLTVCVLSTIMGYLCLQGTPSLHSIGCVWGERDVCVPAQEGLVRLLLDAGANIDAQSCNGGTPLMRAIETSQKNIIKLLLERG